MEGVVEANQLYLLMKNPDDALVFVGFGNDMSNVASMLYPTSSVYGSITFYTAPDYDSKAYTVDNMVECYCLDLPVSDWTQVWNPYTDEYLFTEVWNFMMADG